MRREDALGAVVEVLTYNGMGHFSAVALASQIVDAVGIYR